MKSHLRIADETDRFQCESSSAKNALRVLDGFEEHFWLKEQSVRCGHVLAADIHGMTTREQWQFAFAALQKAYPVLSVSIRKEDGVRPAFYTLDPVPLLLSIQPLSECAGLEGKTEEILLRPFRDGEPLVRAYLFFSDDRCCLFLYSHHAALDGRSHLLLFHDLMDCLATRTEPRVQDLGPSLSSLVGRRIEPYQPRTLEELAADAEKKVLFEPHVLRVSTSRLGRQETQELVLRAKFERCSVHSAVLTALAIAGCELSPAWGASDITCLSPFDVRGFFGIQGRVGLLIALHRTSVSMPTRGSMWSIARQITSSMHSEHLKAELPAFVERWQSLTRHERVPAWSPFIGHDLMLTSYGTQTVDSQIGHLTIQNVFTAGFAGGPSTQKFSALTVAGSLGLSHVAREPIPGMLETTQAILRTA